MKKLLLVIFIFFISNSLYAIEFEGQFFQGNLIIGKTDPNSKIIIDKNEVKVSKEGYFVFGIDRDHKTDLILTKIIEGKEEKIIKKVNEKKYEIQRIDGLPESMVTPPESV